MKTFKTIMKWIFALFFIGAGINHFVNPDYYLKIIPPYLPWHPALNYVSGFFEVFLGILLLVRATTRMAAWGLIALLLAVYPANIYMLTDHQSVAPGIPVIGLWIRLALQLVLMGWAYWLSKPGPSLDRLAV